MLAPALAILALLSAAPASAGPSVSVLWRVNFTTSNGPGIRTEPSAAYLQTLRACGHQANLRGKQDLVPIQVLRCRGVLDFASNASIRERVDARFRAAIARGHKAIAGHSLEGLRAALRKVDFAISPYGVFFSALDGPGAARLVAINVEQLRLVILNKVYWRQLVNAPDADALLVHEALGAMGLGDTDYQLSNTLFFFGKSDHKPGDGDAAGELPDSQASREGGGSVVGRGGDSSQQLFKASLLAAVDSQKIELLGVEQRFVPSKEELRRVINATAISTAKPAFFSGDQRSLCNNDENLPTRNNYYCGGFLLKGARGVPFLVITAQWAEFPERERWRLVLKVFKQIVTQLVQDKIR